MTNTKDIASFFENGTTEQFEYCFKLYPEVLKLKAEKRNKKPQELIRLDQWYQNELPKLIKGRGKDAHMVYDELVQTMKWKQCRGKFYPQLSYLVKVNTPRAVMQETKKAFRKLPNLEQAITALSNLKGVGTTMASALLAAAAPDSAPFMADECLMAIPGIEGIDYTTKEYLNFVQHIQSTVERLNAEVGGEKAHWSPHRVELALWAHYVANDLSPELLDEMPGPGSGGGVKLNGNASAVKNNKEVNDANEDTNDGVDEESLGTGDNENTNSNLVSNDSTSQEPILDDNTTQTTATTSTDDGDVGTPLASDSESNLEAPQQRNAKAGVVMTPKTKSNNKQATSNGNGTTTSTIDSLDGDNSSCLQVSEGGASEDYDDVVGIVDESSNSTGPLNLMSNKSTTVAPLISLTDGTSTGNEDSTLSSSGIVSIGQKRQLHCGSNAENSVDGLNQQPEIKKIRNE